MNLKIKSNNSPKFNNSDADRVKRLTLFLAGYEGIKLSEQDKKMLVVLNRVNELLSGGEIRKSVIAGQIATEYKVTPRTGYMLIRKCEELFGIVEYTNLRADQVHAIRIYEWIYTDLKEKWIKTEKTWYMTEMIKVKKEIDKIKGVYKSEVHEIDYGLWRRPTLIVSDDVNDINK